MKEDRKLKVSELGRVDEATYKASAKVPLRIALDQVRSGNNVGSVFRTADAFRIDHIYLGGITPSPPQRDILKTSLGAERSVEWSYHNDLESELRHLQSHGWKVAVVEQTADSTPVQDWRPTANEHWVLVLGNEVRGVDDAMVHLADCALEIPQFGTKHSLNIAVCAGMVIWEYMRCTGLSQL